MYSADFQCKYYDEAEFKNLGKRQNFSVLSHNIRSLSGKFDELKVLLAGLQNFPFSIIALQEVWSVSRDFRLKGYELLEYATRDKTQSKLNPNCGGGVGFFIKEGLNYEIVHFGGEFEKGVYESLWLKINISGKTRVIGNIYRPNTAPLASLQRATEIHTNILKSIKSDKQLCKAAITIVSDFNINLLNFNTHPETAEYADLHMTHGLLPMITKPTHIYNSGASLIDHIFVSPTSNPVTTGVLVCDVSDHFPTFYIEELQQAQSTSLPNYGRRINEKTMPLFKRLLEQTEWNSLPDENPEAYFDSFFSTIQEKFDAAMPVVKLPPPRTKPDPPWFTASLKVSHKRKAKLYRKCLTKKTNDSKKEYKAYANSYKNLIKNAKKRYYENLVTKFHNDTRKVWGVIREVVCQSKKNGLKFPDFFFEPAAASKPSKSQPPVPSAGATRSIHTPPCTTSRPPSPAEVTRSSYTTPCTPPGPPSPAGATRLPAAPTAKVEKKITDKQRISDGFNSYYCSVGSNLAAQIDKKKSYLPNLPHPLSTVPKLDSSFEISLVNTATVSLLIDSLSNKTSSGTDGISNKLLKFVAEPLLKPLQKLINTSIQSGMVPQQLKIAKVLPIYKGADAGSKHSYSSYRPIAILNTISKVLEKAIECQLRQYFSSNGLFYKGQYGFRPNRNTTQALLDLTSHVHDGLEQGKSVLGVFIDLSKAFDTLNFDILLQKLSKYGVCKKSLKWFQSYISGRTQKVALPCGTTSKELEVTTGVPQGSILGPLLFIIYVNDLPGAVPLLKIILFADDTSCLYSSRSESELYGAMSDQLKKLEDFFLVNKLSLNVRKTRVMAFHSPEAHFHYDTLVLDGEEIEWCGTPYSKEASFKFLGVLLDSKLGMGHHLKRLLGKLSSALYALAVARDNLPLKVALSVYRSLYESHIIYACAVWGSAHPKLLLPIFSHHTKACKLLFSLPRASHLSQTLHKSRILKPEQIIMREHIKLAHSHRMKRLPQPISNILKPVEDGLEARQNRNSENNMKLPGPSVIAGRHFPAYKVPKAWNNLPPRLKSTALHDFEASFAAHIASLNDRGCEKPNCPICD